MSTATSQADLFPNLPERRAALETSSTFKDNLALPVHRWFKYSAGFSALWVRDLLQRARAEGHSTVLDPFMGSGTVVLEGERGNFEALGLERQPFVLRVARAKLAWRSDARTFQQLARQVLQRADEVLSPVKLDRYPELIHRCFSTEALQELDALRTSWAEVDDGCSASELVWLTLVAILRDCSGVGTAQSQYVLPNQTRRIAGTPLTLFAKKARMVAEDMLVRQTKPTGVPGVALDDDARTCSRIPSGWAHLIITSPPYANNFDYADATRLEMSFLGDVSGWGDLHEVRDRLVRSCSHHAGRLSSEHIEDMLTDELLEPIVGELAPVFRQLDHERQRRRGRKKYHALAVAYFHDMARVWKALRRVAAPGAEVCFVVGDSAPYGVHLPVERWLGRLAESAGFTDFRFEKTRDRNVKWRNRKHRVPLHEGRLQVRG